jgi:hypothetical protein
LVLGGNTIKKTIMMTATFVIVVSQLATQKEIQDGKHNSSSWFLETTQ